MSDNPVYDKVMMALSEAGYPDAPIRPFGTAGLEVDADILDHVPPAVIWIVHKLAVPAKQPCWACWSEAGFSHDFEPAWSCEQGKCAHPEGPARPPRELLRPPPLDKR